VLQAKNYSNLTEGLRLGVAGARSQAAVAGYPFGAAVVKRRNKGAADAYVVMDLETFTRFLATYREAP
jgi:hypothetical protein